MTPRTGHRHMVVRLLTVVALVCVGLVQVAAAQSLGEVARKEEERRKAVKAGKVYTNDSLRPEPQPSSAPVQSTPAGSGGGSTPAGGAAGSPGSTPAADTGGTKNEAYWQKRLTEARDALQRAQSFAEALQSQINGLTTDFVNRDDPAQRAVIATNRDKALAELERVKKEIAAQTKAVSDIQDEGRRAGAPAGWLR